MSHIPEIEVLREAARARGLASNLSYAGALTPQEAFRFMRAGAQLVDVRTQAELYWVGRVPGAFEIEWNTYPGGVRNPAFISTLARTLDRDRPVMFLCRSGGRSHHAAVAATEAGFRECYNVLEGFEGDRDPEQHRGTLGGWKRAGLPWVQS